MPATWSRRPPARVGGAADGDVVRNDDPRLTDARPPTAGSVTATSIAAGAVGPGAFVAGTAPARLVDALPTLPDTDWPAGSVVVLTSDSKVYRSADGATWTVSTDGADITAGTVTAAKITATFALVAGLISSTSYVAGTSGWAIKADGTAEFNSLVVRGLAELRDDTTEIDPNPGFETNNLDGWSNNTNFTITNETVHPRTGSRNLKLTTTVGSGIADKTLAGLTVGRAYRFSMYVKVAVTDEGPGYLTCDGETGPSQLLNSSTWTKITVSFVASAASVTLQYHYLASGGGATIQYFDDQSWVEATQITAGFIHTVSGDLGVAITPNKIRMRGIDSITFAEKEVWSIGGSDALTLSAIGSSGAVASTIVMGNDDLQLTCGLIDLTASTAVRIFGDLSFDTGLTYATKVTSYGGATSWTAVTTNPTNRLWQGYYTKIGKKVDVWIFLTANTSFTVGNGAYIVALPVAVDTTVIPTNAAIGDWVATIAGANTGGIMRRQGTDLARFTKAAGGSFGSGDAMTATDTLSAHISYMASV